MDSTPPARPSHVRTWTLNLALLAAGLAVAALAAEYAVILIAGEQPKFPRHVVGAPWGIRMNQPGARYRHKSADVSVRFAINGQGMRADRDVSYAKPPGVLRIVSLGDSFTAGYEVEASETFSSRLADELEGRGYQVEVLNAGVSGFSNAEEAVYLERELFKYDPDLVLVSFFNNDLVDNLRAHLFRLENDALVEENRDYVPAGGLADFLNTNWLFNLLSEYSDAFVLVKERVTATLQASMVRENVENLALAANEAAPTPAVAERHAYERRLAAAILQRIADRCRERGIGLLIQSIPEPNFGHTELLDDFPYAEFAVDQPGVAVLAMKPLLDPLLGREPLYYERSHEHWTPLAHEISARALADLVDRQHLFGAREQRARTAAR
jgi:lysophospholipase L1-like esterase